MSDVSRMQRPVPPWGETIGFVDEPRGEGVTGPAFRVSGWALSVHRIRAIELRGAGATLVARYGLPREDVALARPGYPDVPACGFSLDVDAATLRVPQRVARCPLAIVAIAGDGRETLLGRRSLVDAAVRARWSFVAAGADPPFYLIPTTSGVAAGGAEGLADWYSAYLSPTTAIGMRVPILYLRTTAGAAGDYAFDAEFDVRRRNGERVVADDALSPVLAHARAHGLPVLVTLNGGIWADASGTCPAWDLIDRLEEDPANCQWNERDEVMPDDHLAHLPGSHAAPELARALTLNVYARDVRACKRRNLQQAAGRLAQFMREAPQLLIGVNLDPDVYVNPFFTGTQWYDYNPGTLRQFRHWLAGSGPYAGACEADVPDLSTYRRATPLSLAEASALAGRRFARWDDVDPPRAFPHGGARPHWEDPWVAQWEVFRRHLVTLHYDELAQWVAAAGIPRDRIWSSQGLDAPADVYAPPGGFMPLALSQWSAPRNFDSGGVTIEGSKPRDGHLGAIVYGAAATNEIPMENARSLYATLAAIDPGFGLVEFNTADLRHPQRAPTYAQAYRALRELWNAGARFVSPMAWNGANGVGADTPGHVAFTAWRNTALESAACDFLLDRCGLPRGSRLWTFGTAVHADDDGWCSECGTLRKGRGRLDVEADAHGDATLVSPAEIAVASDALASIVVGLPDDLDVAALVVAGRDEPGKRWRLLADVAGDELTRTEAGRVARATSARSFVVDRLRLTIRTAPHARFALTRVALLQE